MTVNPAYVVTENNENDRRRSWSLSREARDVHAYTYDEAIDFAGDGLYCMLLVPSLCITNLAMGVDLFGFSVVVSGAACDLNIGIRETGLLLTVTFIGPILMAYPWGYLSDTKGRRKSLLIALWTSFLMSFASAFAPNWQTMAVLKLLSTSFSSCAQSTPYTFFGESCSRRFRDSYMLIIAGILDFSLAVYVVGAYIILDMDFSYDLGYMVFTPWRLLALVLSSLLGFGAFALLFFQESPKYLLNDGRHDEALDALTIIWKINGGKGDFPVKKVILMETGNERPKGVTIWRSLWEQLAPIFKPPLLQRSLQLYFMVAVLYGTNNSYFMWMPDLANKFVAGMNNNIDSNTTNAGDVCTMIESTVSIQNNTESSINCSYKTDIAFVWFSLIQGVSFVLVLFVIAKFAHRKRWLCLAIMMIGGLSAMAVVFIKETITSFIMLFGVLSNQLAIGIIYSYYVDLYPTSFRGMAACLGTMVARSSALTGVSLLGEFVHTHCADTFYVCSALMLGAAAVAYFLPKDKPKSP